MKYKEIVPKLKRNIKEKFNASMVQTSLTRYQSGGGGSILYITTWSHDRVKDEDLRAFVEDELDYLDVSDLEKWQEVSVRPMARRLEFDDPAKCTLWRHVPE